MFKVFNIFVNDHVCATLGLHNAFPFKLQEVVTIPCQLPWSPSPTLAPTFNAGARLCQHCYVALGRSALLAAFPGHIIDCKQISESPCLLPGHTCIKLG